MEPKKFDVKNFVIALVELGIESSSKEISDYLAKLRVKVSAKTIASIRADYSTAKIQPK